MESSQLLYKYVVSACISVTFSIELTISTDQ